MQWYGACCEALASLAGPMVPELPICVAVYDTCPNPEDIPTPWVAQISRGKCLLHYPRVWLQEIQMGVVVDAHPGENHGTRPVACHPFTCSQTVVQLGTSMGRAGWAP